jgi:hypothetical protein
VSYIEGASTDYMNCRERSHASFEGSHIVFMIEVKRPWLLLKCKEGCGNKRNFIARKLPFHLNMNNNYLPSTGGALGGRRQKQQIYRLFERSSLVSTINICFPWKLHLTMFSMCEVVKEMLFYLHNNR